MKKITLIFILILAAVVLQAQIIKTSLTVTVRDELGNTVEGAKVMLFETEASYKEEKSVAAEGTTDKKGVVKFKNQKAISYFIIVRKGDKDNAGAGEQTGQLEEKKINKVTIVIQ